MGFDFRFRSLDSRTDLAELVDFLMKQSLGYPGYDDWVQRTEAELIAGYKQGIIVTSNGQVVGDCIYQPHKQLPRVREIKNMRVHPKLRRRALGYFMLKQAEVEDSKSYDALILDVRTEQKAIISMLRMAGYTPAFKVNLHDDKQDLVMVKSFDKQTESGVVYGAKELFLG